jgi:hypothetical protein
MRSDPTPIDTVLGARGLGHGSSTKGCSRRKVRAGDIGAPSIPKEVKQ